MKKYIILISIFFLFSVQAEVVVDKSSKTVEGLGNGATRTEALNNAIVEALGQLNGVSIVQKSYVSDTSIETTKAESSSYIYNKSINRVTKGKVDSYTILEVNKYDEQYEVRVEITKTRVTKKYKTPGYSAKNRRAIVIVPSYTNKSIYSVLNQSRDAKDISQRLTQELVSSITQTRKFTVLDREANEAYRDEKLVLRSRDATTNELLKLGQVLGADYLLVTNVTEFNISKDSDSDSIVANMSSSYKTSATIQYRIIAMATRQIKWSNTSSFNFEVEGKTNEQVYLNSLKKLSSNIKTELIENIYPIKVVNVSSNKVVINQGSLQVGTRFEVYKLGKNIIDTYTKESLGRVESKVALIEVIRSLPKMSTAKVIEGKALKGDICRTINNSSEGNNLYPDITEEDKPSNTHMNEGGGVVLPFD